MSFGGTAYKPNEDFWRKWEYDHERDDWTLERIAYNTVQFTLKDNPHRWAVVHHDTTIVEQHIATLMPGAHPDAAYRVVVSPWDGKTTRDRVNDLAPGLSICTHKGTQYFSVAVRNLGGDTGMHGGPYPVDDGTTAIEYDLDGRGDVVQILDSYVPMLSSPWDSMHKLEKKLRRVIAKAGRACPPISIGRYAVRPGTGGALLDKSAAWAGAYVPDCAHGTEARLSALEAFVAQLEVIGGVNPQSLYSRRNNIAVNCGVREPADMLVSIHDDDAREFIKSAIDQHTGDGDELTFGDVEKYLQTWEKLQEAAR